MSGYTLQQGGYSLNTTTSTIEIDNNGTLVSNTNKINFKNGNNTTVTATVNNNGVDIQYNAVPADGTVLGPTNSQPGYIATYQDNSGKQLSNSPNAKTDNLVVTNNITTNTLNAGATAISGAMTILEPTTDSNPTTKTYVDNLINMALAGLSPRPSCLAATTPNTNLNATYTNGTNNDGVGATLINAGALGAFSLDDQPQVLNGRYLIKDLSSFPPGCGFYILTRLGDASTRWILTRAPDADQTSELSNGDFATVIYGTVNKQTSWTVTTSDPINIGTTPITFGNITTLLYAGVGISILNNVISITNQGTPGSYGSVSQTLTILTNAQGQVTGVTVNNIAITSAQVTDFVTASQSANASAIAAKVNKAGDTMTGALILNADPTQALGAATRQFVLSQVASGAYTAGTGISIASNSISIANVIAAGSAGSASKSLAITYNAQGQITAITANNIAISNSQVTDFANGVQSLAPNVTINSSNPNGLSITASQILSLALADANTIGALSNIAQTIAGVKTFNSAPVFSSLNASLPLQLDASKNVITSLINLASQITGTLGFANGGTGQTTQQNALNALAGAVNNLYALVGDGTNVSMRQLSTLYLSDYTTTTTSLATSIAQAITYNLPVRASAVGLCNTPLSATYNNGVSGVGATLTATANGTLTYDGISAQAGHRVIINAQSSAFQNGFYLVTNPGSSTVPFVLTRLTEFNSASTMPFGTKILIGFGATYAGQVWKLNSYVNTVGTDSVNFVQDVAGFANGGTNANNRQSAINNLIGAVTNGYFPVGDGTNIVMRLLAAADIPTITSAKISDFTSAAQSANASAIAAKVSKAGDTMTGALILNADPTQALQAATMQWVQAQIAAGAFAYKYAYVISTQITPITFTPTTPVILNPTVDTNNLYGYTSTSLLTYSVTGSNRMQITYTGATSAKIDVEVSFIALITATTNNGTQQLSIGASINQNATSVGSRTFARYNTSLRTPMTLSGKFTLTVTQNQTISISIFTAGTDTNTYEFENAMLKATIVG